MSFAQCKDISIRVSGEIPNSEIYYGLYIATTPRETWDEGWRNATDPVFTHFWVVSDNKIIDRACDQFGGPEEVVTDIDDPHYIMVGKYKKEDDTTTPLVEQPIIEWDTRIGKSVLVHWKDFNKYMRKFK